MAEALWTPTAERVAATNIDRFRREAAPLAGGNLPDYDALYDWSVSDLAGFWHRVWHFCGVIGDAGETILDRPTKMPGAQFFPEARLNYAENLLRRNDDADALVFWGEDKVKRRLSWGEMTRQVSSLAQALAEMGVGEGDRVAGYMPNMPETIIGMLAATSLGAVWSSASPDFGVQGVLDRFGQVQPKVLLVAESYWYNGKLFDCIDKSKEVAAGLADLSGVIVVPYGREVPDLSDFPGARGWGDLLSAYPPKALEFTRVAFNAPLFIMFSSGTTGAPKCIVHGVGGTLLKHMEEQQLQCDIKPNDRVFYFTTCGWMMWNWLASALSSEATLLLYDGSPFAPDGNILFDYADAESASLFGTSAKYIDALAKSGLRPRETHKLETVRTICSTGSPLAPEGFDYVYDAVKSDVQLASIAGGTDIIGCFVGGCPVAPVYRGEIQKRFLGMAVEVWNDEGKPVVGEKGELVCVRPFPSMPIGFWNDPEGSRYRAAYFDRYPGIWCHGDYVELTERGGMVIYGRSDAVLNPGGVRIGTAEIYRQVEQLDEVLESLVIGQDWQGDVRVVLFVRLREGLALDDSLIKSIRDRIRTGCTPRHVPAKVIQVADIPRTKSGKIVELAVRDVVHGRAVKNKEALANPGALDLFANLPALAE